MPFVSELVSLSKAVQNLALDISSFHYEDTMTVPIKWETTVGVNSFSYVGQATVHKTGIGDLGFQHPGSLALDWLGFHPDLATAWDLVPLSFVVDYLLPIGDFLESFRQGGWVKVMLFEGWITVFYDLSYTHTVDHPDYETATSSASEATIFQRFQSNDVLVVQPDHALPSFETPSFREMFNMLYLLTQRK
jgi:hypothetical protein